MKFEEPRWACSIPARPSITPSEFCALVNERATTGTPSEHNDGNNSNSHEGLETGARIHLKHTVPEYLEAFRSLHVAPRPCKHWMGSKWQRELADLVIEQKKKKPDDAKAQQEPGAANEAASYPAKSEKGSGPSTVGMSKAFMDQLKTRRRDELKKAQEKAAEERREQERLARINEKVLEVKRHKLEALNRDRAAECTIARQRLTANLEASKALATRLESVNQTLKSVEVWDRSQNDLLLAILEMQRTWWCSQVDKHNAVTRLKAKRAEQSSGAQLARTAQTTADAHALGTAALPPSNGTSAKAAVGDVPAPQTDAACKQEGQQQNGTAAHGVKPELAEGALVLALGVVVNPPTFPPPAGFIVPRLFGSYEEMDSQVPIEEPNADRSAKGGPVKRKREDDKAQPVQNKAANTPAGFLPPPQPLSANTSGGKSTLPPAPNTNMPPGNPPRSKVKRSEPPGPGPWPNRNGIGRFSDDIRPRHHGSDVFGGVRGSSGPEKRPETGSFIARPAGAGHSQGFLPRVVPEEGDDLLRCANHKDEACTASEFAANVARICQFCSRDRNERLQVSYMCHACSGRPGFLSSKGVGVMAEGLKPLPAVGPNAAVGPRGNFLDQQHQLLPPPPVHSMKSSDDVPPPPAWNLGPRVKKEDKGGD